MSNQCQKILSYLRAGHKLTPLQALDVAGTLKLSTRIGEIRKELPELTIAQERVAVSNKKSVMSYWIPRQAKQEALF